jgi:acyl-CoA reductase-like NAD-dependent aldehyde dehydrogenase
MTTTLQNSSEALTSLFVEENQIPEAFRIEPVHQREYLCNGEMKKWDGPVQEVYSPIYTTQSGELKRVLLGSYPIMSHKEAMESLDAAVKAYDNGLGEWPTMRVSDRIKCMEKFVFKMIEQRELVIKLLMWEIAKSYADAAKEFDRTVVYIKDTIDALKDTDRQSSRFEIKEGYVAQIRRSPLGVVLSMGPFNYPLNETFTTLIPAIIMGNTVVFKTPKLGVLLFYPLLKAFQESFPKGVINNLYGRGAEITPTLMQTGKINVLAFIGSSKVANELKKQHPRVNRLRAVLSLDAKNAAIVTRNANLQLAVNECISGALSYNGQRCTALKIIFVHRSVADQFLEKLNAAVDKLQIGLPWTNNVQITPVAEASKPAYLQACIEDAIAKGAKVVNNNGGAMSASFVKPAVVYPVNAEMRLYHEEQFGPIIPVVPFDEVQQVVEYQVNATHGMQVSIFSEDAKELASLIDPFVNLVARVNINTSCQRGPDTFPFTGRKDSAEGTLSVSDALRSFSIRSLVATKMTDDSKQLLNEIVNNRDSNFLSTDFIF